MGEIYTIDTSLALCHYGRKGMKWGQHIYLKNPITKNAYVYSRNVKRYANPGETLDKKEKYVSFLEKDAKKYKKFARDNQLWDDHSKPLSEYTYKTKGVLRAKNAGKTWKHVLKTYGDDKVQKLLKEKPDPKTWTGDDHDIAYACVKKAMREKKPEIIKHLKRRGYNAMYDIEDWYSGDAEAPLIVFNPKKKMKKVSERNIKRF